MNDKWNPLNDCCLIIRKCTFDRHRERKHTNMIIIILIIRRMFSSRNVSNTIDLSKLLLFIQQKLLIPLFIILFFFFIHEFSQDFWNWNFCVHCFSNHFYRIDVELRKQMYWKIENTTSNRKNKQIGKNSTTITKNKTKKINRHSI